jgi:hypothetical protein
MAVRGYLRGVCLLGFLVCRGVVALVSLVARQVGRRQPPDARDDELVLAA